MCEPLERRRLLASGSLDPNFGGGDGYVLLEPFTGPIAVDDGSGLPMRPYLTSAHEIAEADDGKIYIAAAGHYRHLEGSYGNEHFPALVRLNADGTPDAGFGSGGALLGVPFRFVSTIEPLASGDVLVGGAYGDLEREDPSLTTAQPEGWGLFRVSADGQVVTRLGPPLTDRAAVIYDFHEIPTGPDAGRVLVLSVYGESDLAVWMAEPDGSLVPGSLVDVEALAGPAFFRGNYDNDSYRHRYETAHLVAGDGVFYIQADFRHTIGLNFGFQTGFVRFDLERGPGGTTGIAPSQSFGTFDTPQQQIGILFALELSAALQGGAESSGTVLNFHPDNVRPDVDSKGRLVIPGQITYAGSPILYESGVARVDASGDPDTSFGQNGLVNIPRPNPWDDDGQEWFQEQGPSDLHILEDGSMLVIGEYVGVDRRQGHDVMNLIGVYRLKANGSLDRSFASESIFGAGRSYVMIDPPAESKLPLGQAQPRLHNWTITRKGDLLLGGAVHLDFPVPTLRPGPMSVEEALHFIARMDITEDDSGGGGGGGGGGDSGADRNVTAQLVTQDGGLRVLEITGSEGDNRVVLRLDNAQVRVLNGDSGDESAAGNFDLSAIDRIEVTGGVGADELRNELGSAFGGFVTLSGGAGNDVLVGGGRYDRLFGDEGDDSLTGDDGHQLLMGGPGNDSLVGGGGRDALWGEAGNDLLAGSLDSDYLDGGLGADTLQGEAGDDTLVAGAGNDLLDGGDGPNDLIWTRDGSSTGAQVDLRAGTAAFADSTDALLLIEHILGSDGDDELRGDDGRNLLFGGGGNDRLFGLQGKDTLFGGAGSDRIEGGDDWDLLLDLDALAGGSDADTLIGGGGFDMALMNGDADEKEEVERAFNLVDDLLNLL